MEETFKSASTGLKSPSLTITSDCQGTLYLNRKLNLELMEFLSDAKRAGHEVIITTAASDMASVDDVLDFMIMMGRTKGHNLLDIQEFQRMGKAKLMAMNLAVDIAFDDEPIAGQVRIVSKDGNLVHEKLNYAKPAMEVRVSPDFTTTPITLDQLRIAFGIPKGIGGVASAPAPAP